ncbi:hypothetical protein QF042_002460 [Pedobacter sp. W3I1]|nr:hypothetical protein [Pedobacter sp. W3I1]
MAIKNLFVLILVVINYNGYAQINICDSLKNLYDSHQYLEMDKLCSRHKSDSSYYLYKGAFANVCNNPILSNQYLNRVSDKKARHSFEYWRLRNDNWIKLFNYKNAFQTSKVLTTTFKSQFDSVALGDEINSQRIWEALQDQPPQQIKNYTTITLTTKKDKAGLITCNVSANNVDTNFVFDTGAGISCITESMGKKMGILIMPDNNIEIMSFTGISNKVSIGIMPLLNIGALTVYNTPFLIYPDSAFTFANGTYVINGIIGFPVAKDLGTIIIEKESISFSRRNQKKKRERNLFVDQLRPILMLTYKNKTLPFNFDSGAQESLFYKSFYDLFESDIKTKSNTFIDKSSGAGGHEVINEVLEIKNVNLNIGDQTILLPKLKIDKNNYSTYGKANFGNIGQDILRQYKKVIISFNKNYIQLEN